MYFSIECGSRWKSEKNIARVGKKVIDTRTERQVIQYYWYYVVPNIIFHY